MRKLIFVAAMGMAAGCADAGCPEGTIDCLGVCTDLVGDTGNCGGCGVACGAGQICNMGVCETSCLEGYEDCSGTCRDLQSDDYNCGMCDLVCAAGHLCVDGACTVECPEGYTSCSGICKNLGNDPAHCGECGAACDPGWVCNAGTCAFTCPEPYVDCSGSCADLDIDHMNCGACGTECGDGRRCEAGSCVNSCLEGLTMCSGACFDLTRDPENCGSCAARCGTGEVCTGGTCVLGCTEGFTDCSGTCRDLQTDRMNCGACGTECADGWVCNAGTCEIMCPSPLSDCGGFCTNTAIDPANCGACGTACSGAHATGYCAASTCGLICDTNYDDCDDDLTTGCEANLMRDTSNCGTCGTVCATDEVCYLGTCAVLTCLVVEDFEAGTWPVSPWVVQASGGTATTTAAHDGTYGLINPGWHYRTDYSITDGMAYTAWIHTSTATGGRFYFGFDATSSGCKSFVIAPNTTDIMFMTNSSWGYTNHAVVGQTFLADHWYFIEVIITGTLATGNLYDSDGATLVNTTSHDYGSMGTGGFAMRGFSDIGVDTIEYCP